MFGLFKNNLNLSQAPQGFGGQAQQGAGGPFNPRSTSQTGWNMFQERNPTGAAAIEPLLPQGMFGDNNRPAMSQPYGKIGQSRFDQDGQMHALPVIPGGYTSDGNGFGAIQQPNPFTQYGTRANRLRYGG